MEGSEEVTPSPPSVPYHPHAWRDAFASVCVPRPRLTVSEWADAYRWIAAGTSPAAAGAPCRWSTDRVIFLRGIMDALSDPAVEVVVVMIASQLGKSEALLNILGYFVDQDPSPILFIQPTVEMAEAFSKERIEPMFRCTPALAGKLDLGKEERSNSRKSNQTIRLKQFPGGYLALAGANAPAGLASRPIRVVLLDEVDRFPASAGTEGDPVQLAKQRTANFRNRKIILVSTPTIEGASKIQAEHAQGDRRQFLVPCPHCGSRQLLVWERMRYLDAEGAPDLANLAYLCEHCGQPIEERHKATMVAAGEWVAQVPGGKDGTGKVASIGDLSALYSPWVTWVELARQYLAATEARDRRGLQEFVNLRLGRPWDESEHVLAPKELEARREHYAQGRDLPAGVRVLTAGVDTQNDRLEVELVGWGVGRESWGVQYAVLPGDPEQPQVWQELDRVLAQTWRTADGRTLGVACTAVDTGGQRTVHAYRYCRARERSGVRAVKGGGPDAPIYSRPNRVGRERVELFILGVDTIKATLMDRLALAAPGPGYCHLPCGPDPRRDAVAGYGQAWFEGLLGERRIKVLHDGRDRWRWVQVGRNEPLDCRVYATAALEILAPRLDAPAPKVSAPVVPRAPGPAGPPRGRRVLSRGVG